MHTARPVMTKYSMSVYAMLCLQYTVEWSALSNKNDLLTVCLVHTGNELASLVCSSNKGM